MLVETYTNDKPGDTYNKQFFYATVPVDDIKFFPLAIYEIDRYLEMLYVKPQNRLWFGETNEWGQRIVVSFWKTLDEVLAEPFDRNRVDNALHFIRNPL